MYWMIQLYWISFLRFDKLDFFFIGYWQALKRKEEEQYSMKIKKKAR